MLTISYNENIYQCNDGQAGTLYLKSNFALVLQGDAIQLSSMMNRIQTLDGCICKQGVEILDNCMVAQRIARISYVPQIDGQQSVYAILKPYLPASQIGSALMRINLDTKQEVRIKHLTLIEKQKLQLLVSLLQKPLFFIFDGMWNASDQEMLVTMHDMIQEYLENNTCYIIATQEASKLFVNYEEYDLHNQIMEEPIANFLEEEVAWNTKFPKKKQRRKLPIKSIIPYAIYFLFVLMTAFLGYIMMFAYEDEININEQYLTRMEEAQAYPYRIRMCDGNADNMDTMSCIPMLKEEAMQRFKDEVPFDVSVAPSYDTYIIMNNDTNDSYFTKADGDLLTLTDESTYSYSNISVLPSDMFASFVKMDEQYHDTGIYINKNRIDALFDEDVDLSSVTAHLKLNLPLYDLKSTSSSMQQFATSTTDVTYYQPIMQVYEVELPIAGIVESEDWNSIYLDQAVFDGFMLEMGYGTPYDESMSAELFGDGSYNSGEVSIYQPREFTAVVKSKEDANRMEEALKKEPKVFRIETSYDTNEEIIMSLEKTQGETRRSLMPYMIGMLILTLCIGGLIQYRRFKMKKPEKSRLISKELSIDCFTSIALSLFLVVAFICVQKTIFPFIIDYMNQQNLMMGEDMVLFYYGFYMLSTMTFSFSKIFFLIGITFLLLVCRHLFSWISFAIAHKRK